MGFREMLIFLDLGSILGMFGKGGFRGTGGFRSVGVGEIEAILGGVLEGCGGLKTIIFEFVTRLGLHLFLELRFPAQPFSPSHFHID